MSLTHFAAGWTKMVVWTTRTKGHLSFHGTKHASTWAQVWKIKNVSKANQSLLHTHRRIRVTSKIQAQIMSDIRYVYVQQTTNGGTQSQCRNKSKRTGIVAYS